MPEMHLRVTSSGGRSAVDCVAESVEKVISICDHMEQTFDVAYNEFRK
jgi:hypothetical protein